ncbi:MAG: NAD-dependent epimerase/dehydratase family protein [Candidatus Kapabacteria bacterium]|nr:NAD-dependent epimerase/dehydratase family protein [Candidatus Kapabacteria bacterium]
MEKILVTGASGQIGTELIKALRVKYGKDLIIATDLKVNDSLASGGVFEILNVLDKPRLEELIINYDIKIIYHLAALLSATGEKDPILCWNVNINGTLNVLELALKYNLKRLFIPSSIAVWGSGIPSTNTPQETVLQPATMYGVTKVAGELLCDYFVAKYKLDCRGIRYPGIISSETLPGGGTTDYAVEIFYEAIKNNRYTSFLSENSTLPMMYMPDCIKATIDLMEADFDSLIHHSNFNLASMSFSPKELAEEIKMHLPDFEMEYAPDYRQAIADSWPQSIDDSSARKEWNWKPEFNIKTMTKDMIEKLSVKYKLGEF